MQKYIVVLSIDGVETPVKVKAESGEMAIENHIVGLKTAKKKEIEKNADNDKYKDFDLKAFIKTARETVIRVEPQEYYRKLNKPTDCKMENYKCHANKSVKQTVKIC